MTLTKICTKCGIEKDIGEFGKDKKNKDGLKHYCKICKNNYERERRNKDREKHNKRSRELAHLPHNAERKRLYREKNSNKNKKYQQLYKSTRRVQLAKQERERHKINRLLVLNYYSDGLLKCKNCGENHLEFLEIDHIDGGGRKHKREENVHNIYQYLKNNNFPDRDKYQVLCSNCNIKKVKVEAKERASNGTPSQKKYYKYNIKLKQNALSHYLVDGEIKCECCGERDFDVLCLDHKNNDGFKHRKEEGIMGGLSTYRWIKQNNYPNIFRILCSNCNQALNNYGYCPHEKRVNIKF